MTEPQAIWVSITLDELEYMRARIKELEAVAPRTEAEADVVSALQLHRGIREARRNEDQKNDWMLRELLQAQALVKELEVEVDRLAALNKEACKAELKAWARVAELEKK